MLRKKEKALEEFKNSLKILKPKNFFLLKFETNNLDKEKNLTKEIRKYINKIKPEIIFTHTPNDIHQDHVAVSKFCISASRHIKNVYFYQSNYYNSKSNFNPIIFVDTSNITTKN